MVEQHHVNVADAQLVQRILDGLLRVVILAAWVEFGDNKYLLAGNARLPDSLPHFLLVAVSGGGVDQPHPACQRGLDRVDTGLPMEAVCAKAVDGHGIAAVKGHALACKIKCPHRAALHRFFQGEGDGDIAAAGAQHLPEFSLCHAVNTSQEGEVPGVFTIVNGDAAALVEDDISRLSGDLTVALGEALANTAHFLESAVIAHVHGQRPFGQQALPRRD